MSPRSAVVHLEEMLEAARRALSFIEGMSLDDFLNDSRTQQAVSMSLLVIGESAVRLKRDHLDVIHANPTVPWQSMLGMRNRIAHGYSSLDMKMVWDTVRLSLPTLAENLPPILDRFKE